MVTALTEAYCLVKLGEPAKEIFLYQSTKPAKEGRNGPNPVWNEKYTFSSKKLQNSLHIKVMHLDASYSRTPEVKMLGECTIQLGELKDSMLNVWIPLENTIADDGPKGASKEVDLLKSFKLNAMSDEEFTQFLGVVLEKRFGREVSQEKVTEWVESMRPAEAPVEEKSGPRIMVSISVREKEKKVVSKKDRLYSSAPVRKHTEDNLLETPLEG